MTVKPVLITGPGDVGPTTFGQFLVTILNGTAPAVPFGGLSMVDARDAADGMIRAAERGKNGEHYILSNRYATTTEIARVLTDTVGRRPLATMPHPVGMTLGFFSELLSSVTGGEPMVTRRALTTLQSHFEVSSAKARRELGATFRPLDATMRDQALWFIEHGYVKGGAALARAS